MTTQVPARTISVVVLSHQAPASLIDAVRSLQAQQPACEVVVVNSGGGGTERLLQLASLNCRVIERRERLNPGAARNLGIIKTSGDIVAFLADDCRAIPGWIAARLKHHDERHAVVASALIPDRPDRLVTLASHVMLFGRRMPECPSADVQLYGASYRREIFNRYGLFREDLRTGEDTDFHARLSPDDKPIWAPDVVTTHKGPATLAAFFRDQIMRGERAAAAWTGMTGTSRVGTIRNTALRIRRTLALLPRLTHRARLRLSLLIIAGNIAYTWGSMRQRR
jgi:glycosyltransferase involved in cell wall biosynthesis